MKKTEGIFQKPRENLRLDEKQIKMLQSCSAKGDVAEWNTWRERNPEEPILLEGACISGLKLMHIDLREACLTNAHLEGTDLYRARLQSAWLQTAFVDATTSFWKCEVNRHSRNLPGTNVRGVGLDAVRIDPGTRQRLEYNCRKMTWEEWYGRGSWFMRVLKNIFIRPFWLLSDYGQSSLRMLLFFILANFIFGMIYLFNPSFIAGAGLASGANTVIQPFFFSVVTMTTTLGFGDIHGFPDSAYGQFLFVLEVVLGYFLLGALITRLNIVFTSGGPRGLFDPYDGHYQKAREKESKILS